MFKPNMKLHRVTDISVELCKNKNIKAIDLDVDNTLSTHHGMTLVEGLTEWIKLMQENGIKLIVLSNSKERRVKPFAEKIGLEYVSLGCKPLPFSYFKVKKKRNSCGWRSDFYRRAWSKTFWYKNYPYRFNTC